ncbi:MAG: DUF3800 domain-containing protein [candidate division Zixibacteria bacterium]|nr:DUF3800 domain-containing protein [candidate division Zixibacteria bacterium]
MALFQAYFDESGTNAGSPIVVLAGFIGNLARWEKFNQKWLKILQPAGIKIFHATDCFNGRREFEGWLEETRRPFIEDLIGVIKNIRPITYLVRTGDFQQVKKDYTDPRIVAYTPYKLCFDRCLLNLDGWANRAPGRDEISVFFEDSPEKHNTEVMRLYEEAMRSPLLKGKHKISRIAFIPKSVGIPLQAADLFAWELRKYHTDLMMHSGRPLRKSLRAIFQNNPKGEGELLDRKKIKEFFDIVISE